MKPFFEDPINYYSLLHFVEYGFLALFPAIKTLEGVLGSSEYWREITKCVDCVAKSQRAMNE